MGVLLEAINFNHNRTSATVDALNIRKNNREFIDLPEWQRSEGNSPPEPKSLPAAYARDLVGANTVTIRAQFKRSLDSILETVEICASDGHMVAPSLGGEAGGVPISTMLHGLGVNVLGTVRPRTVRFGDNGETDFEEFELENVRVAEAGVSMSEVVWCWHFRRDPEDEWTYFDTSTHRIYTVLNLPSCPWTQLPFESGNTQLPWTDVLDHACDWASSAQTPDDAATRVTRRLNALGEEGVFKHVGYPCFVAPKTDNFKCTEFLAALLRRGNPTALLNCTDCATAVSSFSNILGCELSQSRMGNNFRTNDILRIGHSVPAMRKFNMHEVAWEGGANLNDELFDACLNLDNDPRPDIFEARLPVNIPFRARAGQYHDLLVSPRSRNPCEPKPHTRVRRSIGEDPLRVKVVDPEHRAMLAEQFNFAAWSGEMERSVPHPLIWEFEGLPGWKRERLRRVQGAEVLPPSIEITLRSEGSDGVICLTAYECESVNAARSFLLDLLTEFQFLELKHPQAMTHGGEDAVFGDVLFVDPEGAAVLSARGKRVIFVSKCVESSLDVFGFARLFDEYLIANPDVE